MLKVEEYEQNQIIKHNFSAPETLHFKFDIDLMNIVRKAMSPLKKDYQIWYPGFAGLVILCFFYLSLLIFQSNILRSLDLGI